MIDATRLDAALAAARDLLLSMRCEEGYWPGHLSSSALATATAASALSLGDSAADRAQAARGAAWLSEHQNADGGWGDTTDSPSNLSTTLLALSALRLAGAAEGSAAAESARSYVVGVAGGEGGRIVGAVRSLYGKDKTFAVPILMNCALAGMVSWERVPGLPVELAALPREWYRALRLEVVSYALPALIAIGLLIRQKQASGPIAAAIARGLAPRLLSLLDMLQPESGGFLEATPLTAFVAMSLVSLYGAQQPVAARCLQFLREGMREDGSWPIDTNLSVWATTNAFTALRISGELPAGGAARALRWVESQQVRQVHPYTDAAPGGWGWSHLSGSVPDADDTAGALLALAATGPEDVLRQGLEWLLKLQNADGGWPTFCRGWGRLPFDQSSPDLTAHALRALKGAGARAPVEGIDEALERGLLYLCRTQRPDGSWLPLWFGDQAGPGSTNPVLGTSRVLLALCEVMPSDPHAAAAARYLIGAQWPDGSWGGAAGVPACVENTAVAVAALASFPEAREALFRGGDWLIKRVSEQDWARPSPVGLYFARLWYSERIYPVAWTVEALGRMRRTLYGL